MMRRSAQRLLQASSRLPRGDAACAAGMHASTSGRERADDAPTAPAPHEPAAAKPRFYETVRVVPAGDQGYHLVLARNPIRTPGSKVLALPTHALALAVAAEWEWLPSGKPVQLSMPLTGLAATAIDQPKPREAVIESLLKYAHTDSACVRCEPGKLARRQAHVFDPMLAWAADALGWRLRASDSLLGVSEQDAGALAAVRAHLESLDAWRLAAVEQLAAAGKSLVLAAAVAHGRVGVREAVAAARLEEEFQLEEWAPVEAAHDLDAADARTRVAAPAVFMRLLGPPPPAPAPPPAA